jgi:hypothetical protein
VLIIPLDANGVPNLTISAGQITNIASITTASNASNGSRRGLAMDAAGNVYTTNNISELLQVFSPGGNWIASTKSNGTFTLTPVLGVAGDYNGNGVVDGADYVLWRNGGPLQNEVATIGSVTPEDYTEWRARFGNTAGAGSSLGGNGVPEPAALAILIVGAMLAFIARRR